MRINRWLGLAVLAVALVAVFIDGYSYIYRYFNHIPFSAPLQKTQVPTLFEKLRTGAPWGRAIAPMPRNWPRCLVSGHATVIEPL